MRDKIWLVGVNDWIYVVHYENKVAVLLEFSVYFLLRVAAVIVCSIIAGDDS